MLMFKSFALHNFWKSRFFRYISFLNISGYLTLISRFPASKRIHSNTREWRNDNYIDICHDIWIYIIWIKLFNYPMKCSKLSKYVATYWNDSQKHCFVLLWLLAFWVFSWSNKVIVSSFCKFNILNFECPEHSFICLKIVVKFLVLVSSISAH